MTLDELTTMIHAVSKVHGGCSVEFTSINVPDHSRGGMYGIVRGGGSSRSFHDEAELREVMGRLS